MAEEREFTYEVRRGGDVVSTGRMTFDADVGPGDIVHIGGASATVSDVVWDSSEGLFRLVLEAGP